MIEDNIAEWTGEVPARSHKPFDAGSIPVSAIMLTKPAALGVELESPAFFII